MVILIIIGKEQWSTTVYQPWPVYIFNSYERFVVARLQPTIEMVIEAGTYNSTHFGWQARHRLFQRFVGLHQLFRYDVRCQARFFCTGTAALLLMVSFKRQFWACPFYLVGRDVSGLSNPLWWSFTPRISRLIGATFSAMPVYLFCRKLLFRRLTVFVFQLRSSCSQKILSIGAEMKFVLQQQTVLEILALVSNFQSLSLLSVRVQA